jgi:hypothetical protein
MHCRRRRRLRRDMTRCGTEPVDTVSIDNGEMTCDGDGQAFIWAGSVCSRGTEKRLAPFKYKPAAIAFNTLSPCSTRNDVNICLYEKQLGVRNTNTTGIHRWLDIARSTHRSRNWKLVCDCDARALRLCCDNIAALAHRSRSARAS